MSPDLAKTWKPRCSIGQLLIRKEVWTLSLTGKLIIILIVMLLLVTGLRAMYPFLAVTQRVAGKVLILEGWVPTYTVKEAATEFKQGNYSELLVVRALYDGDSKYDTGQYLADYIAEHLIQTGVPKRCVHTVFLNAIDKDRTYASALAAKMWLHQQGLAPGGINILTLGSHARRSRLLYEEAMGGRLKIGVVAIVDRSFNPRAWWRSSEGVREVPFELIAYLYVRLLFRP